MSKPKITIHDISAYSGLTYRSIYPFRRPAQGRTAYDEPEGQSYNAPDSTQEILASYVGQGLITDVERSAITRYLDRESDTCPPVLCHREVNNFVMQDSGTY